MTFQLWHLGTLVNAFILLVTLGNPLSIAGLLMLSGLMQGIVLVQAITQLMGKIHEIEGTCVGPCNKLSAL